MKDDAFEKLLKQLTMLKGATWLSVRGRNSARHLMQELQHIRKIATGIEELAGENRDEAKQ
jgi:hypothetical protein